ncbi:MAG: hypothetical protein EOP10_17910 [Proteobacteria bacterium]|nr:MAG: hypothetical protein EOP10_17910 [Pseudomonadota bacterium]
MKKFTLLFLIISSSAFSAERPLSCHLELQSSNPWSSYFLAREAVLFDAQKPETMNTLLRSENYSCAISHNLNAPFNLTLNVALFDKEGKRLAYQVLPSPGSDSPYLFELGAPITPQLLTKDGVLRNFDSIRCYCGDTLEKR